MRADTDRRGQHQNNTLQAALGSEQHPTDSYREDCDSGLEEAIPGCVTIFFLPGSLTNKARPGWCGSVGWEFSCAPKDRWFDSSQDTCPGSGLDSQ